MTDVPVSYIHADKRGVPSFEALDPAVNSNLLAGSEPGLTAPQRILLADSLTLAQFSVVGLDSSRNLAMATQDDVKASLTTGSGNGALTFTSLLDGAAGNDISIIIAAAGTASVVVNGHEITITPATGSNTATAVVAQIAASEEASLLVSAVAGGTGGSAPGTVSETQLAGGVDYVEAIGVLAHAATSGVSNTSKHGEVLLSGNYNCDADSPLVWHASFDTIAKKARAAVGNPNLVFRSRSATGSAGV